MNDITGFVKMSKYAGERFDLIQAGGGNTSVKLDNGQMLIKASGFLLSDVETDKGYATLNHTQIVQALNHPEFANIGDKREREAFAAELVQAALISKEARPSIETFLHSLLYKFTLHTHPVVVNMVTNQHDWQERLQQLFAHKAIYVQYETPGVELALAMQHKLTEYRQQHADDPQLVFLQNHGLIVSANTVDEVLELNEQVLSILEQNEQVDFSRYKQTNQISNLINAIGDTTYIAYLSEDQYIAQWAKDQQLIQTTPFCPDGYVFCGARVVELAQLEQQAIEQYMATYHECPKVIIYNSQVFLIANNVKKAREMEDVFKFHLMTLHYGQAKVNTLAAEEIRYLGNWEAEKYRQKL
ncbi:class II aldolase/adducin family protein [Paenibacillus campi]|uniref:class II aldolase/adducin family protein n=1 Tax=Paenibacillus campi TaxID=3106031 RepID=UPI002AFE8160|nr:class II aldolase/adducin family protein [Paenibacillus sp. SGZ-1014]